MPYGARYSSVLVSSHMITSTLILRHLIFFLVGIIQDIFITYYYVAIAKEYPWRASITSATVTIINLVVLYQILTGIEDQIISIILVYAVGNGVGTMIVMKKQRLKGLLARNFTKKD